jgi:hypothetical protein
MALTASNWRCTSEVMGDNAVTIHGTTQLHPLGHTIVCVDTNTATDRGEAEFVYLGGLDTTAAGDLVVIDGLLTQLAVAESVGSCAVSMSACVTGEYGWYQVRGPAIITCATTVADNAQLYLAATTATDDSVVTGDHVLGCRTMGASDTNQVLCLIMYPKVANTNAT